MNKYLLPLFLSVSIFTLSSCYKSSDTTSVKSTQTSDKSTPSTDKSVQPGASPAKKADFSGALNDYNSKNYAKSAVGFQEVVKDDTENREAHYYLGKSLQNLKKDDDAIKAFKEAVKLKPDYAEANYELGNIYYQRKDYQTSLPFYEQAAKTDYGSTAIASALGDNYRMLRMPQYSIVQYQKVVSYEPENANAHYNLGLTYVELKNNIAARTEYLTLLKLDKNLAKKLGALIGE
ncbi:MAG: tetratricopeptide repeat protein [Pyrinomonadaceae bacterium]